MENLARGINFSWQVLVSDSVVGYDFIHVLIENEWHELSVLYILQKSTKIIIISKKLLFNYNTDNYVMSVETGLLILLNQSTNHNTACK
jgi:hypothetical protein